MSHSASSRVTRPPTLKAVILTFDRLPTHLLGCYGNEWTETPGFDRLAARGSVFDQHFVEIPGPVGPNHSWWTGQFEYFTGESSSSSATSEGNEVSQNWIQRLSSQGVKCRLLAENTEGLPAGLFYSSEAVGGVTGLNARHNDVPIARLVQRGIEILQEGDSEPASTSSDSPACELLWLHSQGVPSPWLPPRFFAELYLDELEEIVDGEDGQEIASSLVDQFENDPDLVRLLLSDWRQDTEAESEASEADTPSDSDSDEIHSPELERQISRLVFAGYVSMIDRWLLKLLDAIESLDEQIFLVVSANQGHSFGETTDLMPGAVGQQPSVDSSSGTSEFRRPGSLNDTEVRTPLLIAEFSEQSEDSAFGSRHSALVQPVDIPQTLEHWLSGNRDGCNPVDESSTAQSLLIAINGGTPEGRSLAFHFGPGGELGIRNRSWALSTSPEALNETDTMDQDLRLFAKPDDQWDIQNVSAQYREEVDSLLELLRKRLAVRG